MTEKIIIDGVDVAGCSLYLKDNGECLRLLTDEEYETECNAICDYGCLYHKEQLKRLEQENKELKEWKDKVIKLFESACRCKYLNEETDICSYTNEKCININKCVYKYQELNDNYRSALEEIREDMEQDTTCESRECGCDDYAECLNCIKETILNKINEVLNDK